MWLVRLIIKNLQNIIHAVVCIQCMQINTLMCKNNWWMLLNKEANREEKKGAVKLGSEDVTKITKILALGAIQWYLMCDLTFVCTQDTAVIAPNFCGLKFVKTSQSQNHKNYCHAMHMGAFVQLSRYLKKSLSTKFLGGSLKIWSNVVAFTIQLNIG